MNRTGGVAVEGAEASDEERTTGTRFGDRLRSRPGATMGFADARGRRAVRCMNLESGGEEGKQTRERTKIAGARVNGGGGSYAASSTRGDGSSSAASRGSSGRLRSSSARTPAASVARRRRGGRWERDGVPGTGASRGVPVRRRRVRVVSPTETMPRRGDGRWDDRPRRVARRPPRTLRAEPLPHRRRSSRAGSASRSASFSIGSLRGVGSGSVAALEGLGVRTIEELAALSDADVATSSRRNRFSRCRACGRSRVARGGRRGGEVAASKEGGGGEVDGFEGGRGGEGEGVELATGKRIRTRPCVTVTRKTTTRVILVVRPAPPPRAMSALPRPARRSRVATRRARRVRARRRRVCICEPERGGVAAAAGTRRVSSSDPDSPADATWRLREGAQLRPSRVPRSDLSVRADPQAQPPRPGRGAFRARPRHQEGARRIVVPRDLPPRQARLLGRRTSPRATPRSSPTTSSCAPAR